MSKRTRFLAVLVPLLVSVAGIAPRPPEQVSAQSPVVTVRAVDKGGNALIGACYTVGYAGGFGGIGKHVCDGDDGANDGVTTLPGGRSGPNLLLIMDVAPAGYVVGQNQPLTPDASDLTFTLEKGGSRLKIAAVGQNGKSLSGACFFTSTITRIGGYGPLVSSACADTTSKGIATVDGLGPGDYRIQPYQDPDNYARVDYEKDVHVVAGKNASTVIAFGPAGSAKLTILNPDGSPFATNGCWSLKRFDLPDQSLGAVCGPDQSGSFTGSHIPVGTYALDSPYDGMPKGMTLPKKQVTLSVKYAKEATATVKLDSGGQGIVVSILDPDGQPINGGCISVFASNHGTPDTQINSSCSMPDGQQNGTIAAWGLAPGDYFVQVRQFGQGQFAASGYSKAKVKSGKETDITIKAGLASTLVVASRDAKKRPVLGACVVATTGAGQLHAQFGRLNCDEDDGVKDGNVTFNLVPAGVKVSVWEAFIPAGWSLPVSQTVSLDAGATSTVVMTLGHGGSKLTIHYDDDKGAAFPRSCFLIFTAKKNKIAELVTNGCDRDGAGNVTPIAGFAPGDYIARENYSSNGGKMAADAPFTIVKSQDFDLTIPVPGQPATASPVASPVASPAASPVASPVVVK